MIGGRRRAVAAAALVALLTGCATRTPIPRRPAPETLSPGSPLRTLSLQESDAWLRHHLLFGEHREALELLTPRSPLGPKDRLLRALQRGVVLHQAGSYQESNRVFEWAEREADRRYTRSVSRAVGSVLISDRVLAYTPSASEMAMVPYYRMLNYLALGDLDGALVEARKANALLSRLSRPETDRCREDGVIRYLAGLVQRAVGDVDDAVVSLRLAQRSFDACGNEAELGIPALGEDLYRSAVAAGFREIADSAVARYGLAEEAAGGSEVEGDLLLLLEHGFVAHRALESLHVPVHDDDVDGIDGKNDEEVARATNLVLRRLLANDWSSARRHWDPHGSHPRQMMHALAGAYILRLAWPSLQLDARRPLETRVIVGDSLLRASPAADLSGVVRSEMERAQPAILGRLVARNLAKYLVARELEKQAEDEAGELAGFIVARLSNYAANRMEQPDLRSWSLLPDRVSVVRLRLPAGRHTVRLESVGRGGEAPRVHDLGDVEIQPGGLVVVNRRIWGAEAGELEPLGPPSHEEVAAVDRVSS